MNHGGHGDGDGVGHVEGHLTVSGRAGVPETAGRAGTAVAPPPDRSGGRPGRHVPPETCRGSGPPGRAARLRRRRRRGVPAAAGFRQIGLFDAAEVLSAAGRAPSGAPTAAGCRAAASGPVGGPGGRLAQVTAAGGTVLAEPRPLAGGSTGGGSGGTGGGRAPAPAMGGDGEDGHRVRSTGAFPIPDGATAVEEPADDGLPDPCACGVLGGAVEDGNAGPPPVDGWREAGGPPRSGRPGGSGHRSAAKEPSATGSGGAGASGRPGGDVPRRARTAAVPFGYAGRGAEGRGAGRRGHRREDPVHTACGRRPSTRELRRLTAREERR